MLLSALLPDPDGLELEQVIIRSGLVSLVLRCPIRRPRMRCHGLSDILGGHRSSPQCGRIHPRLSPLRPFRVLMQW